MFGVDSSELFLIILVAVIVIGPKDMPRVLRTLTEWVNHLRGMAKQFRSGVDEMIRETEIHDIERQWREQNEAIMKAHPFAASTPAPDTDWGVPAGAEDAPANLPPPTGESARPAPIAPVTKAPARPTQVRGAAEPVKTGAGNTGAGNAVPANDSEPPRPVGLGKSPPEPTSAKPPRRAPRLATSGGEAQ